MVCCLSGGQGGNLQLIKVIILELFLPQKAPSPPPLSRWASSCKHLEVKALFSSLRKLQPRVLPSRWTLRDVPLLSLILRAFPSSVTRLKRFQTPRVGPLIHFVGAPRGERKMKVGTAESASVNWKALAWSSVVQHISLQGLFGMTPACRSNTTGRRGGKEETRTRYEPPHRTSWATPWEGKPWMGGGRGSRSVSSCLDMMFQVKGSEWRGNCWHFSFSGCPEANRSSGKRSRSSVSHGGIFFYRSEASSRLFKICCKLL